MGYKDANTFLAHLASFPDWEEVSTYYLNLRRMIEDEIERVVSVVVP